MRPGLQRDTMDALCEVWQGLKGYTEQGKMDGGMECDHRT